MESQSSSRGVFLHNSIVSHGFSILNVGSPSRINRPPHNNTTSDIIICFPNNFIYMSWKTISDSFGSNHFPILISCPLSSSLILSPHHPLSIFPGFNLNKANWSLFFFFISDNLLLAPVNSNPINEFEWFFDLVF